MKTLCLVAVLMCCCGGNSPSDLPEEGTICVVGANGTEACFPVEECILLGSEFRCGNSADGGTDGEDGKIDPFFEQYYSECIFCSSKL